MRIVQDTYSDVRVLIRRSEDAYSDVRVLFQFQYISKNTYFPGGRTFQGEASPQSPPAGAFLLKKKKRGKKKKRTHIFTAWVEAFEMVTGRAVLH